MLVWFQCWCSFFEGLALMFAQRERNSRNAARRIPQT
jgi:hypothetical protein